MDTWNSRLNIYSFKYTLLNGNKVILSNTEIIKTAIQSLNQSCMIYSFHNIPSAFENIIQEYLISKWGNITELKMTDGAMAKEQNWKFSLIAILSIATFLKLVVYLYIFL